MLGATNRYSTINSLLKQRKTPAFEQLASGADELMRKTYGPQEERNRIVHDAWYLLRIRHRNSGRCRRGIPVSAFARLMSKDRRHDQCCGKAKCQGRHTVEADSCRARLIAVKTRATIARCSRSVGQSRSVAKSASSPASIIFGVIAILSVDFVVAVDSGILTP
jgi:hypothetical protein